MGMIESMTKPKVAVTMDRHVLDAVKAKVAAGEATSVSAYVEDAVRESLSAEEQWQAMYAEVMDATGGPPTREELEQIDRELGDAP